MKVIEKSEEFRESLINEVISLFQLEESHLDHVQYVSMLATSPGEDEWTYERFYKECNLENVPLLHQPLDCTNYTSDGIPDGGFVEGPGIAIRWQRGPIDFEEELWNGCFLVTPLNAVKHQLEHYQRGEFSCPENQEVLDCVNDAILILEERQRNRFVHGVRGGHGQVEPELKKEPVSGNLSEKEGSDSEEGTCYGTYDDQDLDCLENCSISNGCKIVSSMEQTE